MSVPIFQVDAFTATPFAGNPAGVCLLDRPAEAGWMQNVAREMNLSETAFLDPEEDGYRLRWFTPAVEVKLCGHATLASAHVLFTESLVEAGRQVRFQTRSGLLTAERAESGRARLPGPTSSRTSRSALAQALGVGPLGWWHDEGTSCCCSQAGRRARCAGFPPIARRRARA
jgi:PhzF family phenazine biosynthesis protein